MHWSIVCFVVVPLLAGALWSFLGRSTERETWRTSDPRGAELSDRILASAETLTKGSLLHRLPGSIEVSLKRDLAELSRRLLPELALQRAVWTRAVLDQPGSLTWSAAAAALRDTDAGLERLVSHLERLELELLAAPVGSGAARAFAQPDGSALETALTISGAVDHLSRRLPRSTPLESRPVSLYSNGLQA